MEQPAKTKGRYTLEKDMSEYKKGTSRERANDSKN